MKSITIVVPCLNEEANVGTVVQRALRVLDGRGITGELVIVNDGSSDRTGEVAQSLAAADPRVKVLHHAQRQGIGASFFDGVRAASMDCVMLIPGDNEIDPADALTYLRLADDVDIIVPFIYNVEIRSRMRRIVSSLYRFIINVSFGTTLNYTNGTVIYNALVVKEINPKSKGFFYQAEALITLIRRGYLYAETPHFLAPRTSGTTKALSLKSVRDVTAAYLGLMIDTHILRTRGRLEPVHPGSETSRRLAALRDTP